MNSTKARRGSAASRKFFSEELMPLADRLRGEGRTFFPLKGEPGAMTYYSRREKTAMTPEDFELVGCDDVASFEGAIVDLWKSQGYPELTSLAPSLSKLAASLYHVKEQSEEVSPFIYVMF